MDIPIRTNQAFSIQGPQGGLDAQRVRHNQLRTGHDEHVVENRFDLPLGNLSLTDSLAGCKEQDRRP
jgi:hypothetical protein